MSQSVIGNLRVALGLDSGEFQAGAIAAGRSFKKFERDLRGGTQGGTKSVQILNQQIKQASQSFAILGRAFLGGVVGGIAASALSGMTSDLRGTVKGIADMGDAAKRSGLPLATFQEWKFVAEQNRIGIDQLVDGFKELNLRADEFIATGGGSAAEAFRRLSLDAAGLRDALQDPSEMMLDLMGRMEGLDRAAQIRVADELFGGSAGERFVELLSQGEAGIRQTISRARELGIVLDRDAVDKATKLDAKFAEVAARVTTMWQAGVVGAAEFFRFIETEEQRRARETDSTMAPVVSDLELLKSEARAASAEMLELGAALRGIGQDSAGDAIVEAANEMGALVGRMDAGAVSADDFRTGLQSQLDAALAAADGVSEIDQIGFSNVVDRLGGLSGMLGTIVAAAAKAAAAVRAIDLSGVPTGGGETRRTEDSATCGFQPAVGVPTARPIRPGVDSYGNWLDAQAGGGGGGGAADGLTRGIQQIKEETAALQAEARAFLSVAAAGRDYGGAMQHARQYAELLAAAQKEGREITPELAAQLQDLARGYAEAALEADRARQGVETFGDVATSVSDATQDMFKGIITGAESAGDAFSNLASRMLDELLNQAISPLTDALGGFFQSLLAASASLPQPERPWGPTRTAPITGAAA